LKHSDHPRNPLVAPGETRSVDRIQQVNEIEQTMLEKLIKIDKMNKSSSLKGVLEGIYTAQYSDNVWKTMLRKARFHTEVPDGQEFVKLLSFLYNRHLEFGDYYNYTIDEECVTDQVIFMSHEMLWNFQRNGQALAMDTTMKTNRFGLPMCLVCGVDEYGHTMILAVALTSHQNAAAFEWILTNIHRAVGDQCWKQVKSIMTDGDKAMKKAIESCLPHAKPLRCVFHLKLNIQSNVSKQLGDKTDAFIERWNNISSQSLTIDEFEAAKKQLTDDFPDVDEYMKANIWKVQDRFVFCLTKSITTFGMKSTQRVEGKNAKLKGALGIDSSSELVGTAGKLITSVTEEQQRKIDDDRKLIQQPNSHSLSSWSWKMKTICTPMAVAWIRKESELEENYTVVGPNVMHQFIVQPANHVRDEYHSMLDSLTNEQRQQMFAAAITQDIAFTEAKLDVDEERDDSESASSSTDTDQLQRAAVLHLLMHEL
jgi:MULE transposase domain